MARSYKTKPPCPVVAVLAFDWATYDESMIETDDAGKCTLADAWIVGFLVHESEDRVVLAREHFEKEEQLRRVMVISKATIRKRINFR